MIGNFFKVNLRHLSRSKFFAVINISGLAVGIACSVIIYLYIRHELSFDNFHKEGDKIFRVIRQSGINGVPYDIGVTSGPFAEALVNDYAGRVNSATRAYAFNSLVTYCDKSFIEEHLMLADENFFEFFSYPFAQGHKATVLSCPRNVVVTKQFARRYFGDKDPIGKILHVDKEYDLVVAGVLDDLPGNTHLKFDLIGSLALIENEKWFQDWWNNGLNTYIKVNEASDVNFLRRDFPDFMDKYLRKDFERIGNRTGLKLESLQDIYFNNDTRYEEGVVHGDRKYVFIFGSAGVLLILLASINYMNLAAAQAARRAKEVGIRKTLGSARSNIATQFLSESFLLSLASVVLALGMVQASIPFFESATGIVVNRFFADPYLWVFLALLLIFITMLSGSYPSFLLSSFQPVKILKGEIWGGYQYVLLRKTLVAFQFGISIFMIIATLVIGRQLDFMREKDLGFAREQVLMVRMNNEVIRDSRENFRNALMSLREVQFVSSMTGHPGGGYFDATTVNVEGFEEKIRMRTLFADEDFSRVLSLDFEAGRSFSRAYPSDPGSSVILNETAVRQLGWEPGEAIGKRVRLAQFDSVFKQVVGVVKDFHFLSLKVKIEPLIISCQARGAMLVKLSGNNMTRTLSDMEKLWKTYDTGFPLEWMFLDEMVNRLYRKESEQGKIFTYFSILSVFIACLGILGLTSFLVTQRRKEIGIRKVLGADTGQLSFLLMKDTMELVLAANLLAIPLGYFAIKMWLESFAYRIPISPVVFLSGSLIVFIAAFVIVGIRVAQTALENPTKALRSE